MNYPECNSWNKPHIIVIKVVETLQHNGQSTKGTQKVTETLLITGDLRRVPRIG